MSRPGSVRAWVALGLLAAIAGCGGSSSDRGSSLPPQLAPAPYLSFFHPVGGRALAPGTIFEYQHSLRPGAAMRPFVLPAAESYPDLVPITYNVEGRPWPTGLRFYPATRTLSGTLSPAVTPPRSYRLHYRASAPGYRDTHLTVVLYPPPTVRPAGSTTLSFPVGRSTKVVLGAATGGRPPYTHALPGCEGVGWLRLEGQILHGSPTAANQYEGPRQCQWQVTDSLGGVAALDFFITVEAGPPQLYFPAADGTPLAHDAPLPSLGTLVQGEPIPLLAGSFPPAAGAREGTTITYTLEVASGPPGVRSLPRGLSFVSRTLGGTIDDPRWTADTYHFYYVASAPGYGEARLTVAFHLENPLRLPTTSADRLSFPVGEFTRHMQPEAAGGSPPYQYSLEQCPLDWLELVGTELAANPLAKHAGERRLCRYRVTDATETFVELLLDVSAGGAGGSELRFKEDENLPKHGDRLEFRAGEFTPQSLQEAIGGTPPYRYTLDQCTVDWLQLVRNLLAANPRPEHAGDRRLCRYRATDSEDNFVDMVLEVEATSVPVGAFQFENRHIVDRDLPVGSAIEPIVLPLAREGGMDDMTGTVTYELSPLLPPGLALRQPDDTDTSNPDRPQIQGTPTAVSVLTRYCLQATLEATEESPAVTAAVRCFHLRTVDFSVARFTVNLPSSRSIRLFSRLIASTVSGDTVGTTIPRTPVAESITLPVAFLPASWGGNATYFIVPDIAPFTFASAARVLTSPATHPFPTPVVYTYGVRRTTDKRAAAAICFELGHDYEERTLPVTSSTERVYRDTYLTVTYRDEAVRSSTGEYLCHPNPRGDDDPVTTGSTAQSNPVHDAHGMVHARRAVSLAHDFIGERVRDPSPGGEGAIFRSDVDLGRLWGRSGGFSWSGTGESLLAGAHVAQPGGALQIGLVGGFHRTALDYRAEAQHLEGLYSEGEHTTELLSLHPFAAWRFATGSAVWGSVGAGAGSLWFEDDAPPFDVRGHSDLELRSAALGFRHPLPSFPLGTFAFSGLAERIALRIEGDEAEHGIRQRSLRGSDLALGLDWRRHPADADPSFVPSFSFGFRRQTGDGATDSFVDVAGSLAFRPLSNPLAFDVRASTLLGVAGNDSGAWDVRASARYDPRAGPRGLELSLQSTLGASSEKSRAAYGLDGVLSYGIFGSVFGSTVRPYVGISDLTGASGARRTVGLRVRDEPDYRLSLETWEQTGSDAAGLEVRLNRFWP